MYTYYTYPMELLHESILFYGILNPPQAGTLRTPKKRFTPATTSCPDLCALRGGAGSLTSWRRSPAFFPPGQTESLPRPPRRMRLVDRSAPPSSVSETKTQKSHERWGEGVLNVFMAAAIWPQTLASLLFCRSGARRVFTNQADIACTNREAP